MTAVGTQLVYVDPQKLTHACTENVAIKLPNEIQRIIFEIATKLDGRCAYRLILVAKYVHDWIAPILYERVVIRDEKAAYHLLRSIQSYGPNHFLPLTKSLSVGRQIPHKLIKPLFTRLSKAVISFTIFRDMEDPDHLLRYVRSPFIRRLTLIYLDPLGRRFEIPLDISSSISHLAYITHTSHGGFNMSHAIKIASAIQRNDIAWLNTLALPLPPLPPFHRLTFIAVSRERWPTTFGILNLAPELKCFALLLPKNSIMQQISQSIQTIKQTRDPRVVVITRYGHPVEWRIDDGFTPSNFWTVVEDLSRNRYLCDDGERWKDDIVNDFRARHPNVFLLGD